ncbi:MAG: ribonuclease P protein component [Planctomycetales bacterium]|nr:ribonuclease P protein component [Planctomycetales bacterium]
MTARPFPKSARLLTTADFDRVFQEKCSSSDQLLIVYCAANGLDETRLGMVVSKKVGNAPTRNRWKRLIREAFRLSRDKAPAGVDLVVLPRKEAKPTLAGLSASLVNLARRNARRLAQRGAQGEAP